MSINKHRDGAGSALLALAACAIWLPLASSKAADGSAASNAVAVIDFEMAGAGSTNDWALGVADLVALELQQLDIPIFERRSIRLVLAERQLAKLGVSDWRKLATARLPQVQYLVSGQMRRVSDRNCHLTLGLTEVRSGREAASFGSEANYPGGLLATIKTLAQQIAEPLKQRLPAGPVARKVPSGFTQMPEAAWLFYKGLEHCLAGRPEWGAIYFIEAQNADPLFLAAKVWKWRAFQMLDIPEYVQACREELMGSPQGVAIMANLEGATFASQGRPSVALATDSNVAQDLTLFADFKNELRNSRVCSVFDPHQIDSLARELDLQLSENSDDPIDLVTMAWTGVEEVLQLRVEAEPQGATGRVIVEGRDALTGTRLFTAEAPANRAEMSALSRRVAQELTQHHQPPAEARQQAANGDQSGLRPDELWKLPPNYGTNRLYLVELLRCTSRFPKDRRPILRMQALFREKQPRLVQANWSRYIAAVDPAEPQAATRIAAVLWMQRGIYSSRPAPAQFALLLQRYPESLEALNVRSLQALEAFEARNYAEAIHWWTNVIQQVPRLAPAGLIDQAYWASVHYFTAAAFSELKRFTEGEPFLRQAEEILKTHPGLIPHMRISGIGSDDRIQPRWVNHFRADHPYFGAEKTFPEAAAMLRQRWPTAGVQSAPSMTSLEQLERLLQATYACDGGAALEKDKEYLREFIHAKQQRPEQFTIPARPDIRTLPIRQIDLGNSRLMGNYPLATKLFLSAIGKINQNIWLARSLEERRELERMAGELARGMEGKLAAQCYQAAGQYEEALKCIEHDVRPARTLEVILLKRSLLRAARGPKESAAFLLSEIAKQDQRYARMNIFQLAHQAALDLRRAGLEARAASLYEQVIQSNAAPEQVKLSFKYYQAECQWRAGNSFQATELLRGLAKQSEGKPWTLYDHTYSGDEPREIYNLCAHLLQRIRFLNRVQLRSFDWEFRPGYELLAVVPAPESLSPVESGLNQLLADVCLRRTTNFVNWKPAVTNFARQYGRAAVPAVLKMLPRLTRPRFEISVMAELLNQAATVEDAPAILDAFRRMPELAAVAFKLDAEGARQVTAERFPIYHRSGVAPYQFTSLILRYKLRETYPVLIANLADDSFNSLFEVQSLDRILANDPVPEFVEDFRQALSQHLERQLVGIHVGPSRQLGGIALVALKYGAPEGIEGWFRSTDVPKEKFLATLRPLLDLPADDAAAIEWLQTHRGQFTWNGAKRKYELKERSS